MAGNIVHFELPAADADRAQQFWSSLFGWQFGESVMPEIDYRMTRLGETQGAAISKTDQPQGFPNVYFDTDDIDASIAKVRDLGGSADDKMAVPGMGWFTLCKDTEGTVFGLWQNDTSAGQ